jgi:hypothetical protein
MIEVALDIFDVHEDILADFIRGGLRNSGPEVPIMTSPSPSES